MEIGKEYILNNGDRVTISQLFWHYESKEKYYLIISQSGNDWIISEKELLTFVKQKRTTKDKLELYAKYFAGRADVYAQKWSNGKGYSPALKNWWSFYKTRNDKIAQNKLQKDYAPFTENVIREQIMSSDKYHRFGIYPLLKDDTTKLLVFDFDKHNSLLDPSKTTKAVLDTCKKYRISCLPEISSSGNSYHLWLFFKQPVPASTARFLGKLILFEAMTSSDNVNLACFDRMIPNQDRLPQKGFGNLIALPLKWGDVKKQKSIFTDDNLTPLLPSQLFDRLASTKRYSEDELNNLIKEISKDMKLMNGKKNILEMSDFKIFPQVVYGFISGEIYIERQKLTRREQLSLLGLATFRNPEFIKKQQMRMPVWDTPSVLTAAQIKGQYICLPRGILPRLKQKCECHLKEKYTSPLPLDVTFIGELYAEQKSAVKMLSNHQLGMICAHTGFGKTVVGCALIAERKAKTLIIVPTTNIAHQWQKAGLQFLDIQEKPYCELTPKGRRVRKQKVEIITGSRNHPSKFVDIINIRKLIQMSAKDRKNLYQDYEQIIVDECHHISAETFEKTLVEANTCYIVGLTATPERKDGLEEFMHYRCGDIYYQSKDTKSDYLIPRYIYPRYSGSLEFQNNLINETYSQKLKTLVENEDRNIQIVKDVKQALKDKRHILLLSERVQHLKIIKKLLTDVSSIYFITGGNKEKLEIKDENKPYVILSTSKYVGEGFNLPSLDTLFFVLPFSWRGNTEQYLGRLERNLENKDELRVYDYVDISDDVFTKMYQKRIRVYKKQGYEFVHSAAWNTYSSAYYTSQTYFSVWQHDLEKASEIWLRLKRLSKKQVTALNTFANREKKIHLIINDKVRREKYFNLLNSNISVQVDKRKIGNNISVFNNQIVWYGDLNFGSKSYQEMSAIRLVNCDLAKTTIKNIYHNS